MTDLPSGTVAFLFTDIEGSTRLWERDPAAMRAVVARHDALLAAAVARHRGHLFKHVGDAVQAAFPTAADAVAAAADGQRALRAADWGDAGPLLVRMAVHAGEAAPNAAGDYNQIACLNRLSRLLSTGHGGQVLLTAVVRDRLGGRLPPGATLRDLGRHRLRDLLEPERVSQLVLAGLPDTFPPLASLERFPGNLPQQPNPLLGREADLAALLPLVADGPRRLVTLTGPGGAGKTRLALQLAADLLDRFEDGAFLVELGRVEDPAAVVPAVAAVLGLREGSGRTLRQSLDAHLHDYGLLLDLHNLPTVRACDPDLAALLAASPGLRMLATSRRPLRVAAEQLYEVAPLAAPAPADRDPERLAASPAVALFLDRAAARRPGFALDAANAASVAALVRRLDGLPLALELAAAQLRRLSLDELLAGLDHRFGLLDGGDPSLLDHQQALVTTIAWSHDRLAPPARQTLRRLAVFANPWTRQAADAVAADPAAGDLDACLRDLVESSLVRCADAGDGVSRCTMLESVRAFAGERLNEAGETAPTRDRHADWCRDLSAAQEPLLSGADPGPALGALAAVHDDLRSALGWVADRPADPRLAALVGSLWRFWLVRGHLAEGRHWIGQLLAAPQTTPAERLVALVRAGILAEQQGDFAAAETQFRQGLHLARDLGERGREAAILSNLGGVAIVRGRLDDAERLLADAVAAADAAGDRRRAADALANLGALAHFRGDTVTALRHHTASLAASREVGDRKGVAGTLLNLLLLLAVDPAQAGRARAYADEAMRLCRALGDRRGEGLALSGLGIVAGTAGDPAAAAGLHRQALAIFEEIDDRSDIGRATLNLGLALLDLGESTEAVAVLRRALAANRETDEPQGIATALDGLALAAVPTAPADAARLLGAADAARAAAGLPVPPESPRDRTADHLRAALGPHFVALLDEGRRIDPDPLVARLFDPPIARAPTPADPDDPLAALDALVFDLPTA